MYKYPEIINIENESTYGTGLSLLEYYIMRDYFKQLNHQNDFGWFVNHDTIGAGINTFGGLFIPLGLIEGNNTEIWDGKSIQHVRLFNNICSGNGCSIGKPKQNCITKGIFDPNKCAKYSYSFIDHEKYTINISLKDSVKLIKKYENL